MVTPIGNFNDLLQQSRCRGDLQRATQGAFLRQLVRRAVDLDDAVRAMLRVTMYLERRLYSKPAPHTPN